jgi:pentatricopeptide repeat protein
MKAYGGSGCADKRFLVRSEDFTALTMKNAVFWNVMLCGSCKNRRFGGLYRLYHQAGKNQRARNNVSS